MKVLVTGGAGFIGSHLVERQLALGHEVRAIDLNTAGLAGIGSEDRLELIHGDFTDPGLQSNLVSQVDVVYHLASAHLDVSLGEAEYHRVNVGGTQTLLKAAQAAGVKRFVHVSTVGVYGNIDHPPADETTTCAPVNIYGRTKLEGERLALKYGRQSGFPVVVARPAWVYGPRCPRTARLIRTISKGRFVMLGNGRTLRHPIYIDDLLTGLELLATSEAGPGEIYLLAGNHPVTLETLVNLTAAGLKVPQPRLRLPVFAAHAAGLALELAFRPLKAPPPFSRRSVEFFTQNNSYDITKARQRLGFHPQVALESGLDLAIKWHNDQPSNP